jgi:WhiB family redox-sensing transcriptional regulator
VTDWMLEAACRGADNDPFFPSDAAKAWRKVAAAKAVCAGCPVRVECLDHAVATDEPYGVWGGLTRAERLGIRPGRRFPRPDPATGRRVDGCGTTGGYKGHLRRGETPCGRCREANAAYRRERLLLMCPADREAYLLRRRVDSRQRRVAS